MSEPELLWYQFRLRSLLILTLVVAVLCSLGVNTSWLFAGLTVMAASVCGIIGRIVAGRNSGFVLGIPFLAFSLLTGLPAYLQAAGEEGWQTNCWIAATTGGVLAGVSGGLWARLLFKRSADETEQQQA